MNVMERVSENSAGAFVRDFVRKDGKLLKITQYEVGDVGCVVWDAAIVLSYYLESPDFITPNGESFWKDKRVIELGAGTGLVGIQAAANGAHCTITDLEECLPLMVLNARNNMENIVGRIECRTMSWGSNVSDFLPPPDFILLADCIYYEESLKPLIKTLTELSDINTVIFCCYERRFTGNKLELERQFFELLEVQFLKEEIPLERQDPFYRCEEIKIVKLTKKSYII